MKNNKKRLRNKDGLKRGAIIWLKKGVSVSLGKHVQNLDRPFLIISNNKNNEKSPTLNISSLSKANCDNKDKELVKKKIKLPMHVYLDKSKYDLDYDSLVLLEQVFTINKDKVKKIVGYLDEDDMKSLNKAAFVQFIDENLSGFIV